MEENLGKPNEYRGQHSDFENYRKDNKVYQKSVSLSPQVRVFDSERQIVLAMYFYGRLSSDGHASRMRTEDFNCAYSTQTGSSQSDESSKKEELRSMCIHFYQFANNYFRKHDQTVLEGLFRVQFPELSEVKVSITTIAQYVTKSDDTKHHEGALRALLFQYSNDLCALATQFWQKYPPKQSSTDQLYSLGDMFAS